MGLLGFTASTGGSLTASFYFQTGSDESSSESTVTETGFTLSDPELGDSFVTEILTDPVYGTPLFRTLSGASRCIWETGTVRREQIDLHFDNGGKHLELTNLAPDSVTPVTVAVCNSSPEEAVFDYKLNMVHSSNPNALVISSLGDPITEPRDYILPPGCTNVVLEVMRGPIAYAYSEVKLRMAVPCESGFWNGIGMARMYDHSDITFTMNYLRPCPRVMFAGATADDEVFIHNIASIGEREEVMLIVRNDQYNELKWEDADRLENVYLQYRKSARDDEIQRQQQWQTGTVAFKHSDGAVVEFDQHDDFGFMRVYWDVSSVPDGKWEVRVVADCEFSSDATKELDKSSTMVLPGLIDRKSPSILDGFSEPVDGEWDVGDDISIITAENIDWEKGFVLRGEVIDSSYTFGSDMVDTLAVGRSLMLAFSAKMDLSRLVGGKVRISVDDFYDLAGNKNTAPYLWSFGIKQLEPVDIKSKITGVLLTEGLGIECVENRDSGACVGFDALFRAEIFTLLEVSTGRIIDTTYSEVWITPKNATSAGFTSLRCVEAGFTITPSTSTYDKASWELSSMFVELLQDPEVMEDYSALSTVYFKEPNDGGINEGWKSTNGGISAEVISNILDDERGGGEDSGVLGLSKKHLFITGVCICTVLVGFGASYIIFKRTVHKRHKKQREIENLQVELEVEAEITGYHENLDIEHMTREQIRKTTAVKKAVRVSNAMDMVSNGASQKHMRLQTGGGSVYSASHGVGERYMGSSGSVYSVSSHGVGGGHMGSSGSVYSASHGVGGGHMDSSIKNSHLDVDVAFAGDFQENPMRTHPELHPPIAPPPPSDSTASATQKKSPYGIASKLFSKVLGTGSRKSPSKAVEDAHHDKSLQMKNLDVYNFKRYSHSPNDVKHKPNITPHFKRTSHQPPGAPKPPP